METDSRDEVYEAFVTLIKKTFAGGDSLFKQVTWSVFRKNKYYMIFQNLWSHD